MRTLTLEPLRAGAPFLWKQLFVRLHKIQIDKVVTGTMILLPRKPEVSDRMCGGDRNTPISLRGQKAGDACTTRRIGSS